MKIRVGMIVINTRSKLEYEVVEVFNEYGVIKYLIESISSFKHNVVTDDQMKRNFKLKEGDK